MDSVRSRLTVCVTREVCDSVSVSISVGIPRRCVLALALAVVFECASTRASSGKEGLKCC